MNRIIILALFFGLIITGILVQNHKQINFISDTNLKLNLQEVPFEELSRDFYPPCLNLPQYPGKGYVIASLDDYEILRVKYAPQGPYIKFETDGNKTEFKLPHIPSDSNNDGELGPEDVIVYVRKPDHRLRWYSPSHKYPAEKIREENIFTVNSDTIIFSSPPPPGYVSISASKLVRDEINGMKCSMSNFDFSQKSLIGKYYSGNGCFKGFERKVYRDDTKKKIIYRYKEIWEYPNYGCPEILITLIDWISIPRIPEGYEVSFEKSK